MSDLPTELRLPLLPITALGPFPRPGTLNVDQATAMWMGFQNEIGIDVPAEPGMYSDLDLVDAWREAQSMTGAPVKATATTANEVTQLIEAGCSIVQIDDTALADQVTGVVVLTPDMILPVTGTEDIRLAIQTRDPSTIWLCAEGGHHTVDETMNTMRAVAIATKLVRAELENR